MPSASAGTTYQAMVYDHRLDEWKQPDSKPDLLRRLFGYTTGNGQKFPAVPEDVRFIGQHVTYTGPQALEGVKGTPDKLRFSYRGDDQVKRTGELKWSRVSKNWRLT
jgi:hypothetical protein